MLRGYRGVISATVGLVITAVLSAIIWVNLNPSKPVLPGYEQTEYADPQYRPGGSRCDPIRLTTLTGKEVAREADACSEAAEEHRLKSDDLIQQTRAADAARENAFLAYIQAKLLLIAAIIGFLTLIAAGFAAYYARQGYLSAEHALRIGSRPFLHIGKIKRTIKRFNTDEGGPDGAFIKFTFPIYNRGVLPAVNLRVWKYAEVVPSHGLPTQGFHGSPVRGPLCSSGRPTKVFDAVDLGAEDVEKFENGEVNIVLGVKIIFDSRFVKGKNVEFKYRIISWNCLERKEFFIDTPKEDARPEPAPLLEAIRESEAREQHERDAQLKSSED